MPDNIREARAVLRRAGREATVAALFVGLAVLMTWPLAPNLDCAVSDPGDPLLNAWIMEWTWHSLTHAPASFWHGPIFHPLRYTIAFSENLVGITLPLLPLYAAGLKPLVVYNIAMLSGFAFSGYGAYVLGRLVTGSTGAGLIAGIFYAFVPFRFDQMAHLQHVWSGWIPLAVAALISFARQPRWSRAALLAVALLFNGLSNGHWLLFGGAAIALGVVTFALLCGRWDLRYWVPLVMATCLTYGLMGSFLRPYRIVNELYGMERGASEAAYYSAVPSDWLFAGRYNNYYGDTANGKLEEKALFPGAIVLLLAAMTVFLLRRGDLTESLSCEFAAPPAEPDRQTWRKRILLALDAVVLFSFIAMAVGFAEGGAVSGEVWKQSARPTVVLLITGIVRLWIAYPYAWGGPERSLGERVRRGRYTPELWFAFLLLALGYLGSLGMNSFVHEFLYRNVPPFRSLRVPARWAMVAYVGLAMLAAAGVVAIVRRVRAKRQVIAMVAIGVLVLAELRAAPVRWYLFDPRPLPVYEWLARSEGTGAILETPVSEGWSEYRYVFGLTVHHHQTLNGISGYPTKLHDAIRDALRSDPVPLELADQLEEVGCGLLIVHNESFGTPETVRTWLKRLTDAGRLTFLRRFDHGRGGDYVFALTRVVSTPDSLRAPERPDAAGRTPIENARIFLDENGVTYNAMTFGRIDSPRFDNKVKGELEVSGWALSPQGVREVRLSFANRSVTMSAEKVDRNDVRATFPWYPETDRSGFRLTIPERPRSIPLVTDLLVEIVDRSGGVTPLDHVFFEWHPRKPVRREGLDFGKLAGIASSVGVERDVEAAIREGNPDPLIRALLERSVGSTNDEFLDTSYRTLLDRDPDDQARGFYGARLNGGWKRRDVLEAIFNSEEFRRRLERLPLTSP